MVFNDDICVCFWGQSDMCIMYALLYFVIPDS